MRKERKCCQPDIVSFLCRRCKFQCPLRCQDQDRPIEVLPCHCSLGHGIVIFYVEDRLDCHCLKLAITQTRWLSYSHLRPLLPSREVPSVGCLLDHITDLSYGANHTHRLCLTPELALFDISSTLLLGSQSLSSLPNDFLLRTYLNIHSPTIDCAIASTTEV